MITNHQRVELKRAVNAWNSHHVSDLLAPLPTKAQVDQHAKDVILRAAYYFGIGLPTIRIWDKHGFTEEDVNDLLDWFVHPSHFYIHHPGADKISKQRISDERKKRAKVGHVSNSGLEFIASFEGFVPRWEDDGFGNPTIGFGHTRPDGWVNEPITRTQGLRLLAHDIVPYENGVKSRIHVALKQNQFDALVSFVYNVGPGALDDGIAWRINRGDFHGAANIILQYNKANGNYVYGLDRRRHAEVSKLLS